MRWYKKAGFWDNLGAQVGEAGTQAVEAIDQIGEAGRQLGIPARGQETLQPLLNALIKEEVVSYIRQGWTKGQILSAADTISKKIASDFFLQAEAKGFPIPKQDVPGWIDTIKAFVSRLSQRLAK